MAASPSPNLILVELPLVARASRRCQRITVLVVAMVQPFITDSVFITSMDPISMLDTNGAPLDAIEIKGIRCYGYTGYFPEERVLGQWFELDLTIWMNLAVTGADDQLENTLNYADVVDRVTTLLETSRFKTIERLNSVILEAVLAFEPVRTVHSRLVKVSPPIPRFQGRIAIAMTRSKSACS